jgi:hypothetical protein
MVVVFLLEVHGRRVPPREKSVKKASVILAAR